MTPRLGRGSRSEEMRSRVRYFRMQAVHLGCAMCRHAPVDDDTRATFEYALRRVEAHHVLPRSALAKMGLNSKQQYDDRNGMGLCAYHHARHTNYVERIPRVLVPDTAIEFADEFALTYLLDREYPS